jgi:HK97 family phage major capsid protein
MKKILNREDMPHGIKSVRADAQPDANKLLNELKAAWEAFKSENDQHLSDVKKGVADCVRSEKVDKINAEISKLQSQLGEIMNKQAALLINGNSTQSESNKFYKAFAEMVKKPELSLEDYNAYKQGFLVYARRGYDATSQDIRSALQVGADPKGGYTVTPDMAGRIVEKLFETSPMRQLCAIETIGTDALEGYNDLDEADSGWVGERTTRNETDSPELGMWAIPVNEQYAEPKATQKMLDDSSVDIESWLIRKISDKLTRRENNAFLVGNGVLKPRGLLTYATSATADDTRNWGIFQHINTGAPGAFYSTAPGDALIDAQFALKSGYRSNANWLMNRLSVASVRKLKDGDGNYLWVPDFESRQGGKLLGYDIIEAEDMPSIGVNSLAIAFGDFRQAYQIVDRTGVRLLRDPYTQKGYIKFYVTKRVGGGAVNFEALKLVRFGQ